MTQFKKGDPVRYHGRNAGASAYIDKEDGRDFEFQTCNFEPIQSVSKTDQELADRAKEIWKEYCGICEELHSRGFDRYHGITIANQAKTGFRPSSEPSWKKVITEEVIL